MDHYAQLSMSVDQAAVNEGHAWFKWPPSLRGGTRLSTRDIATVAILASLGGVMSAYIGYLGVALNKLVGTPFGAGQFMAGLHVFWIVLAMVLTNRVGVGTATGALKGMVELLAGSGKGVLVLLLSVVAGLIVDAVWAMSPRRGTPAVVVSGALATSSNIVVFLLFTSTYEGLLWLFLLLVGVALVSGMLFGGLLVRNVAETLSHAGILVRAPGLASMVEGRDMEAGLGRRTSRITGRAALSIGITAVAAILFFGGALSYYATVGDNADDMREGVVSVGGLVERPLRFSLEDFAGEEVTVEAELQGEYTHEPMREYTGIPLKAILERAGIDGGASVVRVIGVDEYGTQLDFPLAEVMDDANADGYILVEEHGALRTGGEGDYIRLVCKDLDGGWWVRWVVRIDVE